MTKDEAVKFLSALVDKINAQNNRGTAFPYFYVVHTERWRVAHDEYSSGETKQVWVDTSGDADHTEWNTPKEFMVDLVKHQGLTAKEARKYAKDNLREFTMEKYIDEDNIFFTEEGYKEHEQMNSHNMGRRGRDYYSYVKHAFRNPEIYNLLQAVALVVDKEIKKP